MPDRQSPDLYQRVATHLATWLTEAPKRVAQAWTAGNQDETPFAAQTTQAQRLEYFQQLAFGPDGAPNVAGRQQLLEQYGVAGYAQILRTLLRHQQQGPASVTTQAFLSGNDALPEAGAVPSAPAAPAPTPGGEAGA